MAEKVKMDIVPHFVVGASMRKLQLWLIRPGREFEWKWNHEKYIEMPKYKDNKKFETLPPMDVKTFIHFKNPDRDKMYIDAITRIREFNETQAADNKQEIDFNEEAGELFTQRFDSELTELVHKLAAESEKWQEQQKQINEKEKVESDADKVTNEELNELAAMLMKKFHIHTVRGRLGIAGEEMWAWNGVCYNKGGDVDIRHDVKTILGCRYKKSHADAVINSIKASTDTFREQIPSRPNCANLLNGILEYDNQGNINFIERTPDSDFHEYNFLYVMPIKYDPSAKCPEIDKVVGEVLVDQDIIDEDTKIYDDDGNLCEAPDDSQFAAEYYDRLIDSKDEALLEDLNCDKFQKVNGFHDYLGSILMSGYRIKTAVILIGDGDTGKSSLLNIAEQFVGTGLQGTKNFASVSLKDIDSSNGNRFAAAGLDGKLANIVDELPRVDVKNVDTFKNLVGGKGTEVENKGADRFFMENRAKMLMAGNETPRIDPTVANIFFKRIYPIECINVFNRGEANLDIVGKKYTDEELSGLLNHAIEGLKRLLKNRKYSYDMSATAGIWNNYIGSTNALSEFVKTCIEVTGDPKDFVFKPAMYAAYREWHKSRHDGTKEYNLNQFGGHLVNYNPIRLKDTKVKNERKSKAVGKTIRDRAWTGCKLLSFPMSSTSSDTTIKTIKTLKDVVIKDIVENPYNKVVYKDILEGRPTPESINGVINIVKFCKTSDGNSEDAIRAIVNEYCAAVRASKAK